MIDVRGLTKAFPASDGGEILAVDRVTFQVEPGAIYGLLGPNGAGKTTTMRMLLGLITPTAGEAMIAGYRCTTEATEVKRQIGLVAAGTGVYPNMTAREMLQYFGELYGVPNDLLRPRIDELARHFGFAELLGRRLTTLSTGQRQRVSFARSLVHAPPVMLLDEPTLGLDVVGTRRVMDFLTHLRQEGKAVILCTHRLEEAERVCDRFGLMHHGRIVLEGTLADLRARTGCSGLFEIFSRLLDNQLVPAPGGVG